MITITTNKVFDNKTLDIFYELLKDLNSLEFNSGIKYICNEVKELYPGTNLVALIRGKQSKEPESEAMGND